MLKLVSSSGCLAKWSKSITHRYAASAASLLFDWNTQPISEGVTPCVRKNLEVFDETLRDGLQDPSVRRPSTEEMKQALRHMEALGIECCDTGLPVKPAFVHQIRELLTTIRDEKMKIRAAVACRTALEDIEPAARLQDDIGVPIDVYAFMGSSPLRLYVEGWDEKAMLGRIRQTAQFCRSNDLSLAFVTEDTVRAHPASLENMFESALSEGCARLVLCDTCGSVCPSGVRSLVSWTRDLLHRKGYDNVKLDFHGHRDRGLALANGLEAIQWGVDRIHATALGIGERCGNLEMDHLLVNINLLGLSNRNLVGLSKYVEYISKVTGRAIPENYPAFGANAFETSTGVHAAAVRKAKTHEDSLIADLVYSGVPAGMVGKTQGFRIGPMSGKACVLGYVEQKMPGRKLSEEQVSKVLLYAQKGENILSDEEIKRLVDN